MVAYKVGKKGKSSYSNPKRKKGKKSYGKK